MSENIDKELARAREKLHAVEDDWMRALQRLGEARAKLEEARRWEGQASCDRDNFWTLVRKAREELDEVAARAGGEVMHGKGQMKGAT
jgi:hypothetical protein